MRVNPTNSSAPVEKSPAAHPTACNYSQNQSSSSMSSSGESASFLGSLCNTIINFFKSIFNYLLSCCTPAASNARNSATVSHPPVPTSDPETASTSVVTPSENNSSASIAPPVNNQDSSSTESDDDSADAEENIEEQTQRNAGAVAEQNQESLKDPLETQRNAGAVTNQNQEPLATPLKEPIITNSVPTPALSEEEIKQRAVAKFIHDIHEKPNLLKDVLLRTPLETYKQEIAKELDIADLLNYEADLKDIYLHILLKLETSQRSCYYDGCSFPIDSSIVQQFLSQRSGDLEFTRGKPSLLLHFATSTETRLYLAKTCPALLKQVNKEGATPLHLVTHYGSDAEKLVQEYLEQGAAPLAADSKERIPFRQLWHRSDEKLLAIYLNKHPQLATHKYSEGNQPLHYVDSEVSMKLLVEKGADLEAKNKAGQTPLQKAIEERAPGKALYLVTLGANPSVDVSSTQRQVTKKEPALHVILNYSHNGSEDLKKSWLALFKEILTKNPKNVDVVNSNNKTLLALAMNFAKEVYTDAYRTSEYKESINVVEFLIDQGAKVDKEFLQQLTTKEFISDRSWKAIFDKTLPKVLKENPESLETLDSKGHTLFASTLIVYEAVKFRREIWVAEALLALLAAKAKATILVQGQPCLLFFIEQRLSEKSVAEIAEKIIEQTEDLDTLKKAFALALKKRLSEIVRLLIKHKKADPTVRVDGEPPEHCLLEENNFDLFKLVFENGSKNTEILDKLGKQTLLMHAADRYHPPSSDSCKIVGYLIDHQAHFPRQINNQPFLLFLFDQTTTAEALEVLLKALKQEPSWGQAFLQRALDKKVFAREIVEGVIKQGVSVDFGVPLESGPFGKTQPFLQALIKKKPSEEIFSAVLNASQAINEKSSQGKTAFVVAIEEASRKGADVSYFFKIATRLAPLTEDFNVQITEQPEYQTSLQLPLLHFLIHKSTGFEAQSNPNPTEWHLFLKHLLLINTAKSLDRKGNPLNLEMTAREDFWNIPIYAAIQNINSWAKASMGSRIATRELDAKDLRCLQICMWLIDAGANNTSLESLIRPNEHHHLKKTYENLTADSRWGMELTNLLIQRKTSLCNVTIGSQPLLHYLLDKCGQNDYLERFKMVLAKELEADPKTIDACLLDGKTLFMHALEKAENPQTMVWGKSLVNFLIEQGANLCNVTIGNKPLLHHLIDGSHDHLFDLFLKVLTKELEADPKKIDTCLLEGKALLIHALEKTDNHSSSHLREKIAHLLCERGANIIDLKMNNEPVLHYLLDHKPQLFNAMLKAALTKDPTSIEALDSTGKKTLLVHALENAGRTWPQFNSESMKPVYLLIEAGAKTNVSMSNGVSLEDFVKRSKLLIPTKQ